MKNQIEEKVQRYLEAVSLKEGERQYFASHCGADYAYWSTDREREGSEAYEVSLRLCIEEGWIYLEGQTVMFCGSPLFEMDFDIVKVRRRVEDALRKTTEDRVLAAAMLLDVKF
jgi:hypothetical protein